MGKILQGEKMIIGIDPGLHGAFAVIRDKDHVTYRTFKIVEGAVDWHEVVAEFLELQKPGESIRAVIEKVGAMPGQGVTSMFNFGKNAGTIEGILIALRIPFSSVTPQAWKKEVLAGLDHGKGGAIMHVKNTWPNLELPKTKKEVEGVCDALCIAEYGWNHYARP
jgi:crossover junction endodeoxyribonuclease RuvC